VRTDLQEQQQIGLQEQQTDLQEQQQIDQREQRQGPTLQPQELEFLPSCCKQSLPEQSGLQRGEIVSLLNSLAKMCGEYMSQNSNRP
jgi:hypothetical protein